MKSTTLTVLLTASLVLAGAPAETYASARPEVGMVKEESIFRKKKGYRKKRGFLWGLFKKKDCGCPKH